MKPLQSAAGKAAAKQASESVASLARLGRPREPRQERVLAVATKATTPRTWNHRVLLTVDFIGDPDTGEFGPQKSYAIHEVHYNKRGRIVGWTQNPIEASSDRSGFDFI